MSSLDWVALRELFIARYDDFRRRLRRRLGSDDLARETLHETFIALSRPGPPGAIGRPDAYLYRIALNIAAGRYRTAARRATMVEIEAAMDLVDEAARTAETVEARLDLDHLARAIEELPSRQRDILIAVRLHDKPVPEIAAALGVSRRLVEMELRQAVEYCAQRLERQLVHRVRASRLRASHGMRPEHAPKGGGDAEDC